MMFHPLWKTASSTRAVPQPGHLQAPCVFPSAHSKQEGAWGLALKRGSSESRTNSRDTAPCGALLVSPMFSAARAETSEPGAGEPAE